MEKNRRETKTGCLWGRLPIITAGDISEVERAHFEKDYDVAILENRIEGKNSGLIPY